MEITMPSNIDILQQKALIEIRSTVTRTGRPKLVPYKDKYNYTGFTSVYGYTEEAVTHIRETRSTRGLSRFPVYSDVLYVDFDDNDAAAEKFEDEHLLGKYKYERYHSGGRSIHFHIPIEPMYGVNVPYSQKLWMEQHAPEADMSIYRHSGLYRLPETYHTKYPGKKKELTAVGVAGDNILRIENRPRTAVPTINDEIEEKGKEYFHMILGKLLNTRIDEGGRHPHAYKIAMAGRTSGKTRDYTRRLLGMWNNDNCYPSKQEWELDKLVNWVYGGENV
jgi:hypothetical protein